MGFKFIMLIFSMVNYLWPEVRFLTSNGGKQIVQIFVS